MLSVAFVGWRGMVGSVLLDRMRQQQDFENIDCTFFSTSSPGAEGPDVGQGKRPLGDARNLEALERFEVVVSCQGGEYTNEIYPKLRQRGWRGYFIDAASTLRMKDEAVLVLDPVNLDVVEKGLLDGTLTYVGPNCTVSLMLMAVVGLFRAGLVQWVSSMTYQAASGAGAANVQELVQQMYEIGMAAQPILQNPAKSALQLESVVTQALRGPDLTTRAFGVPLAGSLIPWIDRLVDDGQTREEYKGMAETNKILGTDRPIPIDGICARVGSLRCHCQGLTIKLKNDVPLDEVTEIIASGNDWVKVVPNDKEPTLRELTPAAVSGSLTVPIGRIRKMKMGGDFLTAFTVGDQLLWGAAEPLRRMIRILARHLGH